MPLDFPSSPVLNQQFSAAGSSWVFDGTAWNIIPQMVPAVASDTPPANPAVGQFWWRASNGQLYLWYDDGNSRQWVQAAAPAQAPVTPLRMWEAIGQGLYTYAAVSNISFTNLAAYREIRIKGNLTTASPTALNYRTSSNNGVSYDGGAADYIFQSLWSNGTVITATSSVGSVALPLSTNNVSNASFETSIENFNVSGIAPIFRNNVALVNGTSMTSEQNVGARNSATARNALTIIPSAAFTLSGYIIIEGVRG